MEGLDPMATLLLSAAYANTWAAFTGSKTPEHHLPVTLHTPLIAPLGTVAVMGPFIIWFTGRAYFQAHPLDPNLK
jgi:hypothetical protein